MRKVGVGVFLFAAMLVLLVASSLVSARSSRPMADPTETVAVFLPAINRDWAQQQDVTISKLWYEGQLEEVGLSNNGNDSQDMTGWRLHSVVGDQWYNFPMGLDLPPQEGTNLYVYSGPDAIWYLPSSDLPWDAQWIPPLELVWTTEYIWDDGGDKAVLHDASGQVVDEWCYGTGCP